MNSIARKKYKFAVVSMGLMIVLLLLLTSCVTETDASNTSDDANSSNDKNVTETVSTSEIKINGTVVDGSMDEISTEPNAFVKKLMSFGFTEEEAKSNAEILLTCGIPTIDNCEPTNSNATIDGLIAFRGKLDDDRTIWFTVENRAIFYVALNGEDLYDADNGGYLKKFDEVHIPETEVSSSDWYYLREKSEEVLDKYFGDNVRYYDAWAVGREDNNYMVRCQVSDGNIFTDNWIYAYVWYEQQDTGEFKTTAVKINGIQYEVK